MFCYWVFVFDLIFFHLFDILVISTIEKGSAEHQCPSTSDTTILIGRVFWDGQTWALGKHQSNSTLFFFFLVLVSRPLFVSTKLTAT